MCGLLLLIDRTTEQDDVDPCDCIAHRGPDSSGHRRLHGEGFSLEIHFRRLAIVDLDPRSDQPFGDPQRGLLAFNGEIYNAQELRAQLRARGLSLHTTGDTEVLYELLLQPDWNVLLDQVDGMFGFVLALPSGEIRYGRDRLGIKPLYAAHDEAGRLAGLSSEIGPLRAAGLLGDVDPTAVASAAMFLWTPPPLTGWSNCASVEPGVVWSRRPGEWDRAKMLWRAPELKPAADSDLRAAVLESLQRQVQADVPVALLLSGGLDSSWLAVHLTRLQFDGPFLAARSRDGARDQAEPFEEDAPYAARLAAALGRELTFTDLDVDVLRRIPDLVGTMESPLGDPAALVLMALSERARANATVLLSGVGVEEVFLGYERYQAISLLERLRFTPAAGLLPRGWPLPQRYRERAAKLGRLLDAPRADWTWVSQAYYSNEEWAALSPAVSLDAVVTRHRDLTARVLRQGGSSLDAAAATDRALFLPGLNLHYADRASMRASVELRVPFLAEGVLAAAAAHAPRDHVALGDGKRLFRAAAAADGVPDFITKRRKTGFGAPVRSLLRTRGSDVWNVIRPAAVFDDVFDRSAAQTLFQEHVTGVAERGLAAFGLACLAVWWERNVSGTSVVADQLRALP